MKEIKRSSSKYKAMFLSLFIGISLACNAQQSKYVVITYEVDRNKDAHGKQEFYWIADQSELDWEGVNQYPLYLDSYSTNQLSNCQNGNEVVVFLEVQGDEYEFDSAYMSELENFKTIIQKNRILHQTNVRKMQNGLKETIKIYLTPIKGEFCSSPMSNKEANMMGWEDQKVFMPVGSFSYDKTFFDNEVNRQPFFNDLTISRVSTRPDR